MAESIKFTPEEEQYIRFMDDLGSSVTFGQLGSVRPLMELIKEEELFERQRLATGQ